ncbi:MAG: radical SAM protein [Planctomycetota bacterium]|jgi:nitrogen fixation protein NifB|nr:radical SAM protein [Planctomycetota bacterium]
MKPLDGHPCFSGRCQPSTGRIHLPVSPICNIHCRFCARGLSSETTRPGNAIRIVSPSEAVHILERAIRICPELAVAGVAGPGDPLASDHAAETLELIHALRPELILCLSTNGLELSSRLPRLIAAGLGALTVTVNAVEPKILARLCAGILRRGRFLAGVAGARRLIAAQERGIAEARAAGIGLKINMVLAPGINDGQVEAVARRAAEWGASFINVIPLLPAAELAGVPPPLPEDLESARSLAGQYLPSFRHCRQCRADACGIPGRSDHSRELYRDLGPVETFSHG